MKNKKKGPGFFQKTRNFVGAVAKHVATGMEKATQATQQGRFETCLDCEHFNAHPLVCKECGCNLLVKTSWASAECPLKKW